MRWLRAHADELNIDPNRIASGGGSAGGHVGACTGTVPGQDAPDEDMAISSRPNAMVLFNPVVDVAGLKRLAERFPKDPLENLTFSTHLFQPASHYNFSRHE